MCIVSRKKGEKAATTGGEKAYPVLPPPPQPFRYVLEAYKRNMACGI